MGASGGPQAEGSKSMTGQAKAVQYGKLDDSKKDAQLNLLLPPRDRQDVEQANQDSMPEKYRKYIQLYYENLSTASQAASK